jgi:hypothetical protein
MSCATHVLPLPLAPATPTMTGGATCRGPSGAPSSAAGGAPRDDGEGGGEDAGEGDDGGEVEQDRKMDATIASLIVKNEWSIRVRPGSSGPSRPVKAISGRALYDGRLDPAEALALLAGRG